MRLVSATPAKAATTHNGIFALFHKMLPWHDFSHLVGLLITHQLISLKIHSPCRNDLNSLWRSSSVIFNPTDLNVTFSSIKDRAMASAPSPGNEQLIQTIKARGFFSPQDATKGSEAEAFQKKGFPITTVDGIKFCKGHTFGDPVRGLSPLPYIWSHTMGSWLLDSSSLLLNGLNWDRLPIYFPFQPVRTASSPERPKIRVL